MDDHKLQLLLLQRYFFPWVKCVFTFPPQVKSVFPFLPREEVYLHSKVNLHTHTHPPRPTGKKGHLYSFLGQKCRSGAWRGVACFLISLSYNGQQSHCLTQNYHHHHHHHLAQAGRLGMVPTKALNRIFFNHSIISIIK